MDGSRLRATRKARGLTLRALASKIGISPPAVLKYEKGQVVQPNLSIITKMATVLGVGIDYLLTPSSVKLSAPYFRRHSSLQKSQIDSLLSNAADWLEECVGIETLLPSYPVAAFVYPRNIDLTVFDLEAVESIAKSLRMEWQLGFGPISNITEVLEVQGIRIYFTQDNKGFDACFVWANESIPLIICRSDIPGDRQRFNLCHELGHLILEPSSHIVKDRLEEKMVHRFASAFLVPDEAVYQELGYKRKNLHIDELQLLKAKYGLSIQGWIYRAKDLNIINQVTFDYMFRTLSKQKRRISEPGEPYPTELSTRMKRMLLHAIAEEWITETRGHDLLLNFPSNRT